LRAQEILGRIARGNASELSCRRYKHRSEQRGIRISIITHDEVEGGGSVKNVMGHSGIDEKV